MNQPNGNFSEDSMIVVSSFWEGVSTSMDQTFTEWGLMLPKYIEALAVFFIGVLIGYFVEYLFRKAGEKFHLARLWSKIGLDTFLKKSKIKLTPTHLAGKTLKGIIIAYFLRLAAFAAEFDEVGQFLESVILFIPKAIIAFLIMFFAVSYAGTAAGIAQNLLFTEDKHVQKVTGILVKNLIIAFGAMEAFRQVGVLEELARNLSLALLAMFALAGGLALGLGAKDFVRKKLEQLEEEHPKKGKSKAADA